MNLLLFNTTQLLFVLSPEVGSDEVEIDVDCSSCGFGCFPCKNSSECVPQRKNCDGIVDCTNGYDERNCGTFY